MIKIFAPFRRQRQRNNQPFNADMPYNPDNSPTIMDLAGQIENLAKELSILRDDVKSLQGAMAQLEKAPTSSMFQFLFNPLHPASDVEIEEYANQIRTECGPDYITSLRGSCRYSDLFFMEYIKQRKSSPIYKALPQSKEETAEALLSAAIASQSGPTSLQQFLYRIYLKEFLSEHSDKIQSFRSVFKDIELIVLHLSCLSRINQAIASAQTFTEVDYPIRNLIVTAHPAGKDGEYEFKADERVLLVPTCDSYEAMAQKIAAAYAFISFSGNTASIFKVDDDIRCVDAQRLMAEALPRVLSRDYVGQVLNVGKTGLWRWWHFNKCNDPALNRRPYSLLVDAIYARGDAYFLSSRSINLLAKSSVYLKQAFEVEVYEDLAIGKVLNYYGVYPLTWNLFDTGIIYSTDRFP